MIKVEAIQPVTPAYRIEVSEDVARVLYRAFNTVAVCSAARRDGFAPEELRDALAQAGLDELGHYPNVIQR